MRRLGILVLAGATVAGLAGPAAAQAQPLPQGPAAAGAALTLEARLYGGLRLAELMPILRAEAERQARDSAGDLFADGGQEGWQQAVSRIHDPARMEGLFRAALDQAVAAQPPGPLEQAVAFYRTPMGQKMVGLELAARHALLQPGAEDKARAAFARAAGSNDPRVAAIRALIEAGDLIEPNVAGALNASYAFTKGFVEGGGFAAPVSDQQLLADAWAREAEVRSETTGWMEAYLLLAYAPLTDAELAAYTDFTRSEPGQAVSVVLFAAFDALFRKTARDMGFAAARQLEGRSL